MMSDKPASKTASWLFAGMMILGVLMYASGIKKNLPYTPEIDEREWYLAAAFHILEDGKLNPDAFAHPASTVYYPLALMIHVQYILYTGDILVWPDTELEAMLAAHPARLYLFGRLLNVGYALLCLAALYWTVREWFGERAALYSAWLFLAIPSVVTLAQSMRSDMPAAFFGMLSANLCLKLFKKPTARGHLWAGLAIGLATASRYFMITLLALLLAVDGLLYLRKAISLKKSMLWLGMGAAAALLSFAVTTPYFFLDFETAKTYIIFQNRSEHLGADGLSQMQNLWWYLAQGFPSILQWPSYVLMLAGMTLALWKRREVELALLAFLAAFLAAISFPGLHWQHWLAPALPLAAVFIALTVDQMLLWLGKLAQRRWGERVFGWQGWLGAAVILALTWPALVKIVYYDARQMRPSTRVLAREWIIAHVPPTAKLAQETYGAPLSGTEFQSDTYFILPESSLQEYCTVGYTHIVTSSSIHSRYYAQPERYAAEIAFFEELAAQNTLLAVFNPSRWTGGPVIKIFQLNCK